MSIAQYLSKFALGVNAQGVLGAAKGGTGSTSGGGSSSPTVTAISYSGDDTATNPAGGDTITLTGTNFNVGVKVVVNGAQPSSVTRVSSTQLTFPAPANPAGSYIVYVVNTDGSTALAVPGIQYSPNPVWSTAAGSIGSALKQVSFSGSVVATGDAPITYSIISGALPSGLTLNSSTGAITGTTPNISSSTTYNFTVRSTDAQNQDTDRVFSLSIVSSNPTPTVEYLVVGGGGAGAGLGENGSGGGGGGAGGYRTATGFAVASQTPIAIVVGAGGASNSPSDYYQGNDSSFSTITSIGGGRGGGIMGQAGGFGGSGGGGNGYNSGGSGYSTQGNSGGNGFYSNGQNGGGGGGASGSGASAYSGGGGSGGQGALSSITGTATWYAGGGGGGQPNAGKPAGTGGLGGGGDGSSVANVATNPGVVNTGGGGGGGYNGSNSGGGSGIVVIRYVDTYDAATATTGSPTVTVAGGYRVYKFTSSGSITF